MARLGESGSELLSRLMTEGLKLTLLTALEGGCSLTNKKKKKNYQKMMDVRRFQCLGLTFGALLLLPYERILRWASYPDPH